MTYNAKETADNEKNRYLHQAFETSITLEEFYDTLTSVQIQQILKGERARYQRNGQLESYERRRAGLEDTVDDEGVRVLREVRQRLIGQRIAQALADIRESHREILPSIVTELDDEYIVTCLLQGVLHKDPAEFAASVDFHKFGLIYSRHLSRYMRVLVFLTLIDQQGQDAETLLRGEKYFHFPHLYYRPEKEKKKKITRESVSKEIAPIIEDLISPEIEEWYTILEEQIKIPQRKNSGYKAQHGKFSLREYYGVMWKDDIKDRQEEIEVLNELYKSERKEELIYTYHAVANAFKAGATLLPRGAKSLSSGKFGISDSQYAACMDTLNRHAYNQIIGSYRKHEGKAVYLTPFAKELGYGAKVNTSGNLEITNTKGYGFPGKGTQVISGVENTQFLNSSEYLPLLHHILITLLRRSRELNASETDN